MSITVEKIKNPYNVTFDLSAGRGGVISGSISIDHTTYQVLMVSRDIIDYLAKATGNEVLDYLIFDEATPKSVDDLPEGIRQEALEIKLKLMACNDFQGMDKVNRSKLAIIEEYHKLRQREQKRHFDQMNEIELWLKEELEKIGE